MQDTITEHLHSTYSPDAIILHGSRARGKEREYSDWDFIFLYNQPTDVKSGRELFQEQNVEFSVYTLPTSDIYEQFGSKLQKAKVLYEKSTEGTDLLKQAESYYSQGVHWSPEKNNGHRLWMKGRIDGMSDNTDNPIVFNKYFGDFSGRVFNYWYWILKKEHSQPIYVATEEVAESDPDYYRLVSKLVDAESSLNEKVDISREIFIKLFE